MNSYTKTIMGNSNSTVKDYFLLMKPRVMSLVIFTGFSGLWLSPLSIHPFLAFVAILCIALGAGSAGAINMWYDRDIDKLMKRTCTRPIVTGAISPDDALSFGIIIGFFSVFFMALCINLLAACLLLITILYYVFVYTAWLKRSSIYNIVIGGVSGALPPIIGWAAASNTISAYPVILFCIILAWTPPHSWALSLFCNEDYKRAHIPMMSIVKGDAYTKKQILFYSVLLFIISTLPFFLKMANLTYFIMSGVLGTIFLYYSLSLFYHKSQNDQAKKFFFYSILYLFLIFLSLDLLGQYN